MGKQSSASFPNNPGECTNMATVFCMNIGAMSSNYVSSFFAEVGPRRHARVACPRSLGEPASRGLLHGARLLFIPSLESTVNNAPVKEYARAHSCCNRRPL
jgi:hypothetical protein